MVRRHSEQGLFEPRATDNEGWRHIDTESRAAWKPQNDEAQATNDKDDVEVDSDEDSEYIEHQGTAVLQPMAPTLAFATPERGTSFCSRDNASPSRLSSGARSWSLQGSAKVFTLGLNSPAPAASAVSNVPPAESGVAPVVRSPRVPPLPPLQQLPSDVNYAFATTAAPSATDAPPVAARRPTLGIPLLALDATRSPNGGDAAAGHAAAALERK